MIFHSKEIELPSADLLGGKAHGLTKLAKFFRVPEFIVITGDSWPDGYERLSRLFLKGDRTYAIRSSASVEDSLSASYAGLFQTLLGVRQSEVRVAIETVFKSAEADRVRQYSAATGSASNGVKMAVIVQEMIEATQSGVVLSFAPNTQRKNMLVEAVFGLGEPLVGGEIPPDSWQIDRITQEVAKYQPAPQLWKQTVAGKMVLPSYQSNMPKLARRQLEAVSDLLFRVEREMQLSSADVEFCFKGDLLFALQARPLLSH